MNFKTEVKEDWLADAVVGIDYHCGYCDHILTDMEVQMQPCPHCNEFHGVNLEGKGVDKLGYFM